MGSVSTRRPTARLPHVVCWTLVLVACGTTLVAQSSEYRIVIGTDVVCRAEPHRDAPVVRGHQLGDPLNVSRVTIEGEEWYGTNEGPIRSCWTYGPLTAKLDSMDHTAGLLALAEHALTLGDAADFEHLVAVDNLILDHQRLGEIRGLALDGVSPMLALRHLQVVDRAASRVRVRYGWAVEPLQLAWMRGQSVLRGPEVIGRFWVPASAYWDLYERYADAPGADPLAWAAAQAYIVSDECETNCYLSQVAASTMRYWVTFPEGSHVVEAIERGAERIEYASRFCILVTSRRRLLSPGMPRIEERIVQIRSSLDAVTEPAKEALLTHLDELKDGCVTNAVEDLGDPRAIPGLVRAFGTGRSSVIEPLASFGEAAVPAILEAADDDEFRVVADALATLRRIVTADVNGLSTDAATAIRRTTERWLTAVPQTSATLGQAIRLAGAMGEPGLLQIVETLATDTAAVAARGITDAQSVADLQRLAAEQLVDVPAVPRP